MCWPLRSASEHLVEMQSSGKGYLPRNDLNERTASNEGKAMENNAKVTFQLNEGFPRCPKRRQNLEVERVIVFLLNSFIKCALFRRQTRNRTTALWRNVHV